MQFKNSMKYMQYRNSIQDRLHYYYYMSKIFPLIYSLLIFLAVHSQDCCSKNTISIVGAGVTQVDPDIAIFYVTATGNGKTSLEALSNANTVISQAESVLTSAGLSSPNISTVSINLFPLYNTSNGTSIIIGQQASEVIRVQVGNLDANKNLLGDVSGNLSSVNNISLSGFTFQNSNTNLAYRTARRAAVADAEFKLAEYLLLSGKNSTSVVSIVDQNADSYIPYGISANYYSFQQKILNVPYGKVQVSASVQIKWGLYG